MKRKTASFIDLWAALAAVWLSFTEVQFPWSFIALCAGYFFALTSKLVYKDVLFPGGHALKDGPFAYVIKVLVDMVMAAVPFAVIVALPGEAPIGLLGVVTVYAFLRASLENAK